MAYQSMTLSHEATKLSTSRAKLSIVYFNQTLI